ncbi:MAG: hypothetical protein AB7J28_04525 [Hyphomonadaceae bacterium]
MRLFVIAFWLLAAGSAAAQPQAQLPEGGPAILNNVFECREIADDAARLACFDAAVGQLQSAQQAGTFASVDREQVREVQREGFGFSIGGLTRLLPRLGGREASEEDEITEVSLTVERVLDRGNGYHAFVMTNGSVWRQVQAESARNVRAGTNVTIRQASLGSYMMSSSRGGSAHRVRREE